MVVNKGFLREEKIRSIIEHYCCGEHSNVNNVSEDEYQELLMIMEKRPLVHPGEILIDELDYLDMSEETFANEAGIPLQQVKMLLGGEQDITDDIAEKLSKWLGTSVEFWLNLQNSYDLGVQGREYIDGKFAYLHS